jgi:methyl acetate hydrolase
MMVNQVGAFTVQAMATAAPNWSNRFGQFPNRKQKWGPSFDVREEPEPNGRSAGSIDRAGLVNCSYRVEPSRQVTGAILIQSATFYDAPAVALFGAFERALDADLGAI